MLYDYQAIITQLKPSPEQIVEAENYALQILTHELHETHPDAVILIDEGLVHIVSEDDSSDLIFPTQYAFDALFAKKIQEMQARP